MLSTPRAFALASIVAAVGCVALEAQTTPVARAPVRGEPQLIRLWEGDAPGALGSEDADIPTLTYYPPNGRGVGTAVIVAPGGAYAALAMNHEGRQVANWLNSMGVAAFVLKYRLGPKYHHPVELGDAQRAIRLVRSRAAEFNIQPDRVGMMGFSAGGHLTSAAGTRFDSGDPDAVDPIDRAGSRPDFMVLAYPVILSRPPFTHQGSIRNLVGDDPSPELLDEISTDLHVTAATPPTFIFHTDADNGVPDENSIQFYLALRKAKVPAEMHIFGPGPHGVGLGMTDPVLAQWPPLLASWLRARGLLTIASAPTQRGATVGGTAGSAP